MKSIFERGTFNAYRITDSRLNETLNETRMFAEGGRISLYKTTIFLSHKHSDLDDLKDIIGFLESKYNVNIYIDSMDKNMPQKTNGETAQRIKNIIKRCDKFILLATNDAIESKWCNWELGFGDANKYRDNIALFPIKEKGTYDYTYKGNEYMQIYPFIAYCDGNERYKNGNLVAPGYYVCYYDSDGTKIITPISQWLNK